VTSQVGELRRRLAEINLVEGRIALPVDLSRIRSEVRLLQSHLAKGGGSGPGAPRDRVREAVASFASTGELHDPRTARLTCWGTLLDWEKGRAVLIEDEHLFPRLLDRVDRYRLEPRPFRRCWRGLLDGYLSYDPAAAGAQNWHLLRSYLHDTGGALQAGGVDPDWVKAIGGHPNLLSEEPCRRYGPALLAGEHEEVEQVCADLGITGASWFRRGLVDAQVEATVELRDGAFRATLPRTIDLLRMHEVSADAGLARLLDRYSRCEAADVHPELRDFAVERWSNPWLQLNDAKWGRVTEKARQMVSDWLKLDFIEKFFSLLSADQMNDARRLQFWKKYHHNIDDMYFALGDTASRNPSQDFKDLRRRMAGRVRTLDHGGTPNNNAFIMRIGGHVFVEFGEKGNAMYVFDGARPPFDLTRNYIAGNYTALKHADHVRRLVHRDTDETWEDKFEDAIAALTGIRPGDERSARRASRPSVGRPPPRPNTHSPTPEQSNAGAGLPDSDLMSFLMYHRLKFTDHRDKGGAFWVHADASPGEVSRRLKLWNFAWSPRKRAWWKPA
jgi:hypothetical protein